MKKLLLLAVPAALAFTLVVAKFAHAWIVDASATAYNTTNYTYTNGTAYASGLNDNYARGEIKYRDNNGQWTGLPVTKSGPTQGSAQAFKSSFFAEGTPVKVYAEARGVTDGGAVKVDDPTASANL